MKRYLIIFLGLFLFSTVAFSQQRTIKGSVWGYCPHRQPPHTERVIGASVVIKGTTNGTVTDIDGLFTLNAPDGAILVISSIGYRTTEVSTNNGYVNVILECEMLEEVIANNVEISH